jgi:outer membrane protein TolC
MTTILVLVWVCARAPVAADVSDARRLILDELVEEVLARNPSIEAAQKSMAARRFLPAAARTLPEPMVSFETMGNLVPPSLQRGDPSSARVFGFEQEIPYPGKLALGARIADADADIASMAHDQVRRELVAELKRAFFDLDYAYRAVELLETQELLMKQVIGLAEARYRAGQGAQSEIVAAHLELTRLDEEKVLLGEKREVASAAINRLRERSLEAELGRPAAMAGPKLALSLEELQRRARQSYPALKIKEREAERGQSEVDLARKEFRPDFALGFRYFNRSAIPEMYGLMLTARLPLYTSRRERARLLSALEMKASAEKDRDASETWLSYQVKDAYLRAQTADRLLDLYGGTLLAQARLSVDSARASYEAGLTDLTTVVDRWLDLVRTELREVEIVTGYRKALADLESLVGERLAP